MSRSSVAESRTRLVVTDMSIRRAIEQMSPAQREFFGSLGECSLPLANTVLQLLAFEHRPHLLALGVIETRARSSGHAIQLTALGECVAWVLQDDELL